DKADIKVLSEEDLTSIDRTQIGLAGSPTKVRKTYVPSRRKKCNYVSAETLLGELRDKGALE
ncbi:MAG: electron transfer flavoprotein subunit beta, partial [Clostridia bacterium]|nr:electron transfer flavoprotein subunit beta [Clostridia bacterium]